MGGNFLALDSATGNVLLKTATGGAVAGGVITYARGGTQYVAITSGNASSRLSFGENGKPSVIIYALADRQPAAGASPGPQAAASTAPISATAALVPPDVGRGKELFGKNCAACHGNHGEGGSGPALTGVRTRLDFAATVNWIENPSTKMPRLYPSTLDAQAVVDVAAYVQGF
jgi:alcohol dehydrogenase (cytochrome c)